MRKLSCAARWFRRGQLALWVVGLSLLGWALAAILMTRVYQARQERAFFPDIARDPTPHVDAGPLQREATPRVSADPLVLGRIEIPRVGVKAIVREGDDNATLAIAVGHISGTARPGEGGNMALAGHRDSFFRGLRDIRREDWIRFVTPERVFEYAVDSTTVVDPENTGVLDPTGQTVLTLVTCFPFNYVGHAPKRFIVRASLVELAPGVLSGEEVSRTRGNNGFGEGSEP